MVDRSLPPSLQDTHRWWQRGPVGLLLRRGWDDALPLQALLDGAPIETWGEPVPHDLAGRSRVHVLRCDAGQLVVKRMTRGGVIGSLARRWYLDPRRPVREADVAERLTRRGCATPPVVVARVTRGFLGLYALEVGTRRVEGGCDLLAAAARPAARSSLARAAGRTLRSLHGAGLRHRDLQLKNLLLPPDGDELVVLDLDRCTLGDPLSLDERVGALARLGRSLVKHGLLRADGRSQGAWVLRDFLATYGDGGAPGRGALLRLVQRQLRRTLWARRACWRSARG